MRQTTLTHDAMERELARRTVLETAATDLHRAAEAIHELAEGGWPVRPNRLKEAQNARRLAGESLAAVDQLGWPPIRVSTATAASLPFTT
jgi:hypothetical protein